MCFHNNVQNFCGLQIKSGFMATCMHVMYLWSTYIQSINALWKIPKFVEVGQQIGLHVLIILLLLDITQGYKWNSCMKPSWQNSWKDTNDIGI